MEKRHRNRLEKKYREELAGKPVVCLYIPDDYQYMDEELIDRLRGGGVPHVDLGDEAEG